MRISERAFLESISCAVMSTLLMILILLTGWANADASANPLAGNPLSFDEMLPYLSKGQPIYRSGTGSIRRDKPQVFVEPSDANESEAALKNKTS